MLEIQSSLGPHKTNSLIGYLWRGWLAHENLRFIFHFCLFSPPVPVRSFSEILQHMREKYPWNSCCCEKPCFLLFSFYPWLASGPWARSCLGGRGKTRVGVCVQELLRAGRCWSQWKEWAQLRACSDWQGAPPPLSAGHYYPVMDGAQKQQAVAGSGGWLQTAGLCACSPRHLPTCTVTACFLLPDLGWEGTRLNVLW